MVPYIQQFFSNPESNNKIFFSNNGTNNVEKPLIFKFLYFLNIEEIMRNLRFLNISVFLQKLPRLAEAQINF